MRASTLIALALAAGMLMAACGKKTAPMPPEDVPPGKKERSSSSSIGYAMHSFLIDEVTRCSS